MFKSWLVNLLSETQPCLAYVVFDSGKPGKGDTTRRQLTPNYNLRRARRLVSRNAALAQPSLDSVTSKNIDDSSANMSTQKRSKIEGLGMPTMSTKPHPREVSISVAESLDVQSIVAPEDIEADDCIYSLACVFARSFNSEMGRVPRVLIVSGDSDMQHVLLPNTAWLCLNPRISKNDPKARTLVTRSDFVQQYGFEPERFADYLAIRGRTDKGIQGIGITENVAKGLLRRYTDLRGIDIAIEEGKVNGWHPRVRETLTKENIVRAYRSRKTVRLRRSVPVVDIVKTYWQPRLPSPWKALRKRHLPKVSGFQKEVSKVLSAIDPPLNFVEEYVTPEAGFSLDLALPEEKIAIEVQGPHHYTRGTPEESGNAFNRRTVAKLRQLKKHGWKVLTIGYQDWISCGSDENRVSLVKELLFTTSLMGDVNSDAPPHVYTSP